MRYLKIASDKNPDSNFIELNDFNGFLCTQFQTLGLSRKIEYLKINNRQIDVNNDINFIDYNLTIEILTTYNEFEGKYEEFRQFIDSNKKSGLRLYYSPYNNIQQRYILCDVKSLSKNDKMKPIQLVLSQKSLWLSDVKKEETTISGIQESNIYAFTDDGNGYYSVGFYEDENITNYYCIAFTDGVSTQAHISINCYNEIPLTINIYGKCLNPVIRLFRKGEDSPLRTTRIIADIDNGYHIKISGKIFDNGVWIVENATGRMIDYSEFVDNSYGSPYFFIDNGEYYITVVDSGQNSVKAEILWQEEYS